MNAEGNPLRPTTYIIHNSIHSQSTNMYYICTQRRIGGLFGYIILAKRRRRSIVRADVDGYVCHAFRDDHYPVRGCPRLSNGGGPPIPPWLKRQAQQSPTESPTRQPRESPTQSPTRQPRGSPTQKPNPKPNPKARPETRS